MKPGVAKIHPEKHQIFCNAKNADTCDLKKLIKLKPVGVGVSNLGILHKIECTLTYLKIKKIKEHQNQSFVVPVWNASALILISFEQLCYV